MISARVVVCGSLNMDVIVQSERRPVAGETVLGARVSLLPGGKGSNQAIAAARLGARTAMLGAVGDDAFGGSLRRVLADNGVDGSGVKVVRGQTTGVAVIQVADRDNAITGASGANMTFKPAMVRRGLGQGMIALAPFGDAVPAEVQQKVTAAADKIAGGYNPFTGPITDNTGEVRIKDGEAWGGDKMGSFDWYVEGVIGKAK